MQYSKTNETEKKRTPVKNKGKTIARLIKLLFRYYPVMLPVVLFCIVFNAVVSSVPSVFMQNVIAVVESSWESGDWSAVARRRLQICDHTRRASTSSRWRPPSLTAG